VPMKWAFSTGGRKSPKKAFFDFFACRHTMK
jgi:hypothetical protein